MAGMQSDTGQRQPDHATSRIPAAIFRAYDIRGIVDEELDEPAIYSIARAIGSEAIDQGITRLLVACDGRLSSPRLLPVLIEGLLSTGCDVVNLGMVPTPLMYFATHTSDVHSGLMLTASHNPANYNGLKIVFNKTSLAANQIQRIRQRIDDDELHNGQGSETDLDIKDNYLENVCSRIKLTRSMKVVVDCGNAVPGIIAPALFEKLGCEVIPLYCDVDGHFPNHHPDPTVPANLELLAARVQSEQADLGLAFDGDGDRLGLVTETGVAIAADRLLMLLVKDILPQYPGAPVVFDVKCSRDLPVLIESLGGEPVMHRSGHSYMKQKMLETGAPLGGEYAAHLFLKDRWFGFDDGLYAAARLVQILARQTVPASAVFRELGHGVSTPELKVPMPDNRKFDFMATLIEKAVFPDAKLITIDGLRVEFAQGWGLIRASNTSPALLLRFEADDDEQLARIKALFKALIHSVDKSIDLEFLTAQDQ